MKIEARRDSMKIGHKPARRAVLLVAAAVAG